mmetsp:Transcript_31683/g.96982  ORF Transcript_31683/g.96982 Transcript_31683/m.96982 type:complete len:99 (-) Transcript_31683:42-338(-)
MSAQEPQAVIGRILTLFRRSATTSTSFEKECCHLVRIAVISYAFTAASDLIFYCRIAGGHQHVRSENMCGYERALSTTSLALACLELEISNLFLTLRS